MSFVKKAVKKVFKTVKKIVKKVVKSKWFKIAAIAALTFFTAGVATVGFGFFSGVSTIGGFFGAVGSTMASGFTAVVGGLKAGLGLGQSTTAAGAGTAASGAAAGTAELGIGTAGIGVQGGVAAPLGGSVLSAASQAAAVGAPSAIGGTAGLAANTAITGLGNLASTAPVKTASKSLLGRVFGSLTSQTVGGSMLRTGLMFGLQAYAQNEAIKDEKAYRDSRNVWGSPAFGGSGKGWDLAAPVIGGGPNASVAQVTAGADLGQQVGHQAPGAELLSMTPQDAAAQAAAGQAAAQQPGLLAGQGQPPPSAPGQQGQQYDPTGGIVA